jgi:hypothetical protein
MLLIIISLILIHSGMGSDEVLIIAGTILINHAWPVMIIARRVQGSGYEVL